MRKLSVLYTVLPPLFNRHSHGSLLLIVHAHHPARAPSRALPATTVPALWLRLQREEVMHEMKFESPQSAGRWTCDEEEHVEILPQWNYCGVIAVGGGGSSNRLCGENSVGSLRLRSRC